MRFHCALELDRHRSSPAVQRARRWYGAAAESLAVNEVLTRTRRDVERTLELLTERLFAEKDFHKTRDACFQVLDSSANPAANASRSGQPHRSDQKQDSR